MKPNFPYQPTNEPAELGVSGIRNRSRIQSATETLRIFLIPLHYWARPIQDVGRAVTATYTQEMDPAYLRNVD